MSRFSIWAVALAAFLAGWVMAAPASAASIAGGTGMVSLDAGKTANDSLIKVRDRRCGRRCLGGNRASKGSGKRGKAHRYSGKRRDLNSRRISRHALNRGPEARNYKRVKRRDASNRRYDDGRRYSRNRRYDDERRYGRKRRYDDERRYSNKRRYDHKRKGAHKNYADFRRHCSHKYKCGRNKHRHGHYKYYYDGWFYGWPWWSIGWPYYDYRPSYYDYDDYAYDDPHVAYCLGKYRSYVPETDMYLSYSGVWRRCISPYS